MSEKRIKVTDRRMFDVDGNLREEYEELRDAPPPDLRRPVEETPAEPSDPPAAVGRQVPDARPGGDPRSPSGARAPGPRSAGRPPAASPGRPPAPEDSDELPRAGFQDLVGLLAQSASMYLQQAAQRQVQGHTEVVEMARMHVDLLVVLQEKTAGNLTSQEAAMLEDIVYRLRMAFVEVS